ncbi:MAG TPA: LEA type 2 family protein [Chitinophagaceae bacterium]
MRSSLAFGIACLSLSLFLISCRDVQRPVFEDVENLKVGKFELATTTITANVRFNNPNKFGLHLLKIDCDLFVDSARLGHFINTEEVNIPARSTFRIPVQGEVQTSRMMEYARKTLFNEPSIVHVKGTVRVGRSGIYKNVPVSYTDTIVLKL